MLGENFTLNKVDFWGIWLIIDTRFSSFRLSSLVSR